MKKLLLIVGLLVFAGCEQKNLTWTPTQEEWQLMTPTERNDWYRVEMEARESKAAAWQRFSESLPGNKPLNQPAQPIIVSPLGGGNTTYWQEQQAQQEYFDTQRKRSERFMVPIKTP